MQETTSAASQLVSGGAALSGLILVFLGGVINAYDRFETQQRPAVRSKYRGRAWACFVGFLFSMFGTISALFASVWGWAQGLYLASILLLASFSIVVVMAFLATWEI